jgi:hypothetical protein
VVKLTEGPGLVPAPAFLPLLRFQGRANREASKGVKLLHSMFSSALATMVRKSDSSLESIEVLVRWKEWRYRSRRNADWKKVSEEGWQLKVWAQNRTYVFERYD